MVRFLLTIGQTVLHLGITDGIWTRKSTKTLLAGATFANADATPISTTGRIGRGLRAALDVGTKDSERAALPGALAGCEVPRNGTPVGIRGPF